VGGWGRPGGESAPAPLTEGTQLIAVAHGSKDPRAAAAVHSLLGVVAERMRALAGGAGGIDVRAAFLDHCAPSLPQVLGSLADGRARSCIVVPLLLTAAYHSKSDIPAQLAAARAASAAAAVGEPGVAGGLALRCAATSARIRCCWPPWSAGCGRRASPSAPPPTALAPRGAGRGRLGRPGRQRHHRRPRRRLAARPGLARRRPGVRLRGRPSPAEAVAALRAHSDASRDPVSADGDRPVVVASYLLAPGYFADKVRAASLAAGAAAVSAVLGDAPEVADVVLARYREHCANVCQRTLGMRNGPL